MRSYVLIFVVLGLICFFLWFQKNERKNSAPAECAPDADMQTAPLPECEDCSETGFPERMDADTQIAHLLEGEDYSEADFHKRKELVEALLRKLEAEQSILQYHFHASDQQFSYVYPDGSLGGIMLQDFGQGSKPGEPIN